MTNIELIVYGFCLTWIAVVITHALTIAFSRPITQKLTPVQIVYRTTVDILDFNIDFKIDERKFMLMPPFLQHEYVMSEAKTELINQLPDSVFEIFEIKHDPTYFGIRYCVRIKILPPVKK